MIGFQTIMWIDARVSTVFVVTPEGVCSIVKRAHITATSVTFTTMIIGGMELILDVEDFETVELDVCASEDTAEEEDLFLLGDGLVADYDTVRLLDQLERETRRQSNG